MLFIKYAIRNIKMWKNYDQHISNVSTNIYFYNAQPHTVL